jgi:hypothetical protein
MPPCISLNIAAFSAGWTRAYGALPGTEFDRHEADHARFDDPVVQRGRGRMMQ